MSNLWIRDADRRGNTAVGGDGTGGGIDFDAGGSLQLTRTTVSLNKADFGAGINFHGSGGAELRISHDTLILSNHADVSGGGLRVEGSSRLFVLEPQTLIGFNTTDGKGGGIEVLAPARADIGSPGYNGGAVLQFNQADYGGGLAVNTNNDNDVYVRLFSTDAHNPVQIANNTAYSTGGGIWMNPYAATPGGYREANLCAQDFRIAPLQADTAGPELTLHEPAGGLQPVQRVFDHGQTESEPRSDVDAVERPVGARVTRHEVTERVCDRLEEDIGNTDRQRGAECVSDPAGILDREPALFAADAHTNRPPLLFELREHLCSGAAQRQLFGREVAQQSQRIGDVLGVADRALRGQSLQLGFDLADGVGLEQLAQLCGAEQLGEQGGVECERRGTAFGERLVAFVHELPDVAEQQRACHR